MNHQDTLVKATINSFMLQSIAGMFLMSTKGSKTNIDKLIDADDLEFIQSVARNVAHQVMHQSKQQGAPVDLDDMEEQGIDMEFEAPIFVVAMVCTVLRSAVDVLDTDEVRRMAMAWVPMSLAAIKVSLDTNGERKAFNASWEATDG